MSADLSLVMAGTPDPVKSGDATAYALTVTNAGPGTATSVTVTVVLPAGLFGVTASGTGWTCSDPVAGVLTCTRDSLDVTTAPTILVLGSAPFAGRVGSTASVSSAALDPDPKNNSVAVTTTVMPVDASADLSIALSDAPDPVNAGSSLTYTITVTNAGPDTSSGVTVTHTLPLGVSSASGSGEGWTCDPPASGVLTCTNESLPVGDAPALAVVLTAPPTGPATSSATVSAATPDPASGNNSATQSTTVRLVGDLSITMAVDAPDPVAPGGTITYTVTVQNNGPSPLTNVFVALNFTATLTNVTGSEGAPWSYCGSGGYGTYSCGGSDIPVGDSATATFTGTAPAQGIVLVTARAGPTATDPNQANNSAPLETTVASSADLSLTTTDAPDPVLGGTTLTYALAVTNNGPSNALFLSVTDTLPVGLTNVVARGTGWTCLPPDSGAVTCTRTFLSPSAAPIITITGTAPAVGPLTNTATVTSSASDPNPANNSDTETTIIPSAAEMADLSITKSDGADPAGAGLPIVWTIQIANAGPAIASHVVVTETLPPGVTEARASGTGWSCRPNGSTILCERASLPVGSAPAITVRAVTPDIEGAITNLAEVVSDAPDPILDDNLAVENTDVIPVHDIAVLKVKAPAKVKLGGSVTSSIGRIQVQIQNRSPHDETILDPAMLASLVHVTADSLGACPDIEGTILSGSPQPSLPRTLHPKQKLNVWFEVTFSSECMNDPAKSSARDPGHEDYQYLVTVDHAALDGQSDTHPSDDVCPRSVDPPFAVDPYPDGSIKDKGCGKAKGNGTFGDPVLTDVWLRL